MPKLNKTKLIKQINKLNSGKVLVIGDLILDEFILGSPERISREAPVLILEHMESSLALGGASNAASNISSIGSKCLLLGVVGQDTHSKDFKKECLKHNISPILIQDKSRPTTVKTRISSIAHKHPTSSLFSKQQVLRLDRLSKKFISNSTQKKIISEFKKNITKVNAILISDYDLGIFSKEVIKELLEESNKNKVKVIVDAQSNLHRFKGAFLFTPNQPDAETEVGFPITDTKSLCKAGIELLKITEAENILITRGSEGMALFNKKNPLTPLLLPAFNISEVFDVTGAGDTVAGIISAALSIGCPIEEACSLGNLAASLVVKKYGTVTTTTEELKRSLQQLQLG